MKDTKDKNKEDLTELVDVDSLIASVEARVAELQKEEKESKLKRKIIFESIKTTLEEHHIKYVCNTDREWVIEISFSTEDKPFDMQIIIENPRIILHSVFSFSSHLNSIALVCLYLAEFNKNEPFSTMQMDILNGEISMNYTYLINKADNYNAENFWRYMQSFIQPSLGTYEKLNRLAVGKVSETKKKYYETLLKASLAVLNGKDDEKVKTEVLSGNTDMILPFEGLDYPSISGKND